MTITIEVTPELESQIKQATEWCLKALSFQSLRRFFGGCAELIRC